MDFTTWTKQDFLDFDTRREELFTLTPEEIALQEIENDENIKLIVTDKLTTIWITRPEIITKEFCIELLTGFKAEQYIWDDFSSWVDNQIILFWDIEKAFNNLILRFLK